METQIELILSETYTRYLQSGHKRSEFHDITLSVVSWLVLSYRQDKHLSNLSSTEHPLLFSEIIERFDKKKVALVLKSWETFKGSSWKGLLQLDASLVEDIPDAYWQFMLTTWNQLFIKINTDVCQLLPKIFEQLEQLIAFEQKDENMHVTPKEVTNIMAHYLASDKEGVLYDPFVRTGNLLSEALQQLPSVENVVGSSPINLAWKLSKLRLLFASEKPELDIQNEWHQKPAVRKFDFIISNPPFGHQMIGDQQLMDISNDWSDLVRKSNRLEVYFLCHILSHLAVKGRASVLLPGIFLSGSLIIKELIKRLLEQNILDAVIALPSGLFAHTSIPTVLIGIDKNRKNNDQVLLADASAEVVKNGRQNILKPESIKKWLKCLKLPTSKVDNPLIVLVTAEEIAARDYNLYVAAYRQEENLIKEREFSAKLRSEYEKLEDKIVIARTELIAFLSKNSG